MDALLSRATLIGPAYSSSPEENVIINGGMDIWQRGTTSSFAAGANGFVADRWRLYNNTTAGAATINQVTTSLPPVTAFSPYFNYALEVDITTLDAGGDAGDLAIIRYNIEGYDFQRLAQAPMVLSFWVKATVTGTHYVTLFNSLPDRYCIMPYTVITSDTWEYKTLVIPATPSAGTWNYTTSIGMMLNFVLCAGSTHTSGAVAGSWQTGSVYAVSGGANDFSSASNYFRITGVSLVPGSSAKPYVHRSFNQELALCQRYYNKTFTYATTPAQNAGNVGAITYSSLGAGPTDHRVLWEYPVSMRTAPSITFYNPGAANTAWRNLSLGADSGASADTANSSESRACLYNPQVAGDLIHHALAIQATASAEMV